MKLVKQFIESLIYDKKNAPLLYYVRHQGKSQKYVTNKVVLCLALLLIVGVLFRGRRLHAVKKSVPANNKDLSPKTSQNRLHCNKTHFWALQQRQHNSNPRASTIPEIFAVADKDAIKDILLNNQAPSDCAAAKFLLLEDIHGGAGYGAAFARLCQRFFAGLAEGRVVLPASNVVPGKTWRWCGHKPNSFRCYYEPWSPCEGDFVTVSEAAKTWQHAPLWLGLNKNAHERVLRMAGDDSFSTEQIFWEPLKQHSVHGFIFWQAMVYRMFLRTSDWVDARVDILKRAAGVDDRPYITVHVRRGQKITEAPKMLQIATLPAIQKATLTLAKCLRVEHVLVMSEDQTVVDDMHKWCHTQGLKPFSMNYTRHTGDPWNSMLSRPTEEAMDLEGYVAAINLKLAENSVGLVGSFHSQWFKLMASAAYASQGHHVPVFSFDIGSGGEIPLELLYKEGEGAHVQIVDKESALHEDWACP
jgi:hypothetical protein